MQSEQAPVPLVPPATRVESAAPRITQARATLSIFSGRQNPVWNLTPRRIERLRAALATLTPSAEVPDPALDDVGGYQGVFIQFETPDAGIKAVRLFDKKAFIDGKVFDDPGQKVAKLVLAGSPALKDLQMSASKVVAFGNEQLIQKVQGKSIGWPVKTAPRFPKKPGVWNQPVNNCYSYANNARNKNKKYDGAQPGGGATPKLTARSLIAAAKRDGLEYLGHRLKKPKALKKGSHYIAILLLHFDGSNGKKGKAKDFHCLRMDANGVWSHKVGQHGTPTFADAKQHRMQFIDQIVLLWRPELVGFFKSVKGKRHIKFSLAQ